MKLQSIALAAANEALVSPSPIKVYTHVDMNVPTHTHIYIHTPKYMYILYIYIYREVDVYTVITLYHIPTSLWFGVGGTRIPFLHLGVPQKRGAQKRAPWKTHGVNTIVFA